MEVKKKSNKKIIILAIVAVVVILIGIAGYKIVTFLSTMKELQIFADQIEKIGEDFETETDIDMTIYSKGEIGELEKYMKERASDLVVKVNAATEAITSFDFFTPDTLAADKPDLANHKKQIQEIRAAANDACDATITFFDTNAFDSKVDNIKVNHFIKDELKKDVDPELAKFGDIFAKEKSLMNQMFDLWDDMADFLIANNSEWTVESGQLQMTSNTLVEQYNSYLEKMLDLSDQLDAINNQAMESAK